MRRRRLRETVLVTSRDESTAVARPGCRPLRPPVQAADQRRVDDANACLGRLRESRPPNRSSTLAEVQLPITFRSAVGGPSGPSQSPRSTEARRTGSEQWRGWKAPGHAPARRGAVASSSRWVQRTIEGAARSRSFASPGSCVLPNQVPRRHVGETVAAGLRTSGPRSLLTANHPAPFLWGGVQRPYWAPMRHAHSGTESVRTGALQQNACPSAGTAVAASRDARSLGSEHQGLETRSALRSDRMIAILGSCVCRRGRRLGLLSGLPRVPVINAAAELSQPDHPGHGSSRTTRTGCSASSAELLTELGCERPYARRPSSSVMLRDGRWSRGYVGRTPPAWPRRLSAAGAPSLAAESDCRLRREEASRPTHPAQAIPTRWLREHGWFLKTVTALEADGLPRTRRRARAGRRIHEVDFEAFRELVAGQPERLAQHDVALDQVEDGRFGVDHGHAADPSERVGAFRHELR